MSKLREVGETVAPSISSVSVTSSSVVIVVTHNIELEDTRDRPGHSRAMTLYKTIENLNLDLGCQHHA